MSKTNINKNINSQINIDTFTNDSCFIAVCRYALNKGNSSLCKTFLMGIASGLFIGIAYIAALMGTRGNWKNFPVGIKNFVFAIIFTVAIIMIIFMGGEMFTSNSLAFFVVIKGKLLFTKLLMNLLVVLLGNFLGCFITAFLTIISGFLDNVDFYNNIIELINNKMKKKWWNNIASGILCNFLVAGSIYASHSTGSAIAKYFIVSIMIMAFVISGFSHIIANAYLWYIQPFLKIYNSNWQWKDFWSFGYNIQIPTLFGNFLSGGIFLPLLYFNIFKKELSEKIIF